MPKLFKNDNSDSETELNINKDYATNYDTWRQKEELHKLKTRYGDDVEILAHSEEESSDTSEDDEGEEIPEEFEKCFYKTLACLKNKDPRIYNENVKFFNQTNNQNLENETHSKSKKEKSLTLRDYERKIMVERGGKYSDSEDENEEKQNKNFNPTYVQEQQQLKDSFKKVLQDGDDNEEDLLLKPKTKSKEEAQKEEEAYKEWLKGQKNDINEEEKKDLKPLRDFWTNPDLDENEKFLRDYVLNKKFLDKHSNDVDLNYDHAVHDSDENLSEDERNINEQEEFEHKYNFRFEEPDQEFIKRYPRTLENSLRKKDTRRAQKRAEVKTRKEQEKLKKKEELKELKALKRKEIEEKIEKLKEITGNDDLGFNMMDLEGDFDPDTHDKKMGQIFNEEYYSEQVDDMKPEFPEIDDELCVESTWDNYDPTVDEIIPDNVPYHDAPDCEDPNFNMDADYDGRKNVQEELIESSKKKKKRRRTKFAEMLSKEKPKFDPTKHSSYKEYYDQYYALDYEDMIGDLPCRFKYRPVVPNDYGLTFDEIIRADDKELNKWCSLKKALQHKPDYQELNDVKMYKQKAANEALKRKILKSLYEAPEEENAAPIATTSQNSENTKRKRKRKKKNQSNGEVQTREISNDQTKNEVNESSKNKVDNKTSLEKSNDSMEKNSSNTENKHNKKKKRKLEETPPNKTESELVEKKKKKKKKDKTNVQINEPQTEPINNSSVENEQSSVIKNKSKDVEKSLNKNDTSKSAEHKLEKKKKNKNSLNNKNNPILSKKNKRKQQFKKSKDSKEKTKDVDQIATLSSERLKAYGFNPKKFKNKLKYKKKD